MYSNVVIGVAERDAGADALSMSAFNAAAPTVRTSNQNCIITTGPPSPTAVHMSLSVFSIYSQVFYSKSPKGGPQSWQVGKALEQADQSRMLLHKCHGLQPLTQTPYHELQHSIHAVMGTCPRNDLITQRSPK